MKHLKIIISAAIMVFMVSAYSALAKSGQEIYQGTCIACHGEKGKGAFDGIPDLTDKNGRLSKSDEELVKHIIEGFESPGSQMAMPPKGGDDELTDEDVKKVLQYLRKEFGK